MILAAGLGTRLKPFTLHHPKALAMVNGKSLLQRNIEYLQAHQIFDVIINVHHFAKQIVDAVATNNGWGSNISISDESGEVLETGGGLLKAKDFFEADSNFLLHNVDMLTNINITEMAQKHIEQNALATLAISDRNSSRAFLFNKESLLGGWQNTITNEQIIKNTSNQLTPFAFSGMHIINSNIFKHITQTGKFGMVEVYLDLCTNHNIYGYNHSGCKLQDVGKPESILEAEKLFL